jgi:hypothetical protein
MVFDPTAAHVPDEREPARMVRFPDPADPSKTIIVGRSISPNDDDPDAVQFQRSTPMTFPADPTAGLTIDGVGAAVERSRAEAERARSGDRFRQR